MPVSIRDIQKLDCEVFGLSKDSLKSHEKFKAKQNYPFELISDPEGKLCQAFDVLKETVLFGKKFTGIQRSTFVVHKGKIVKEWRSVKVKGHAEEVLESLKQLQKKT